MTDRLKPSEVRLAETDAEPSRHDGSSLNTDAYHLTAPDFVAEEASNVRF